MASASAASAASAPTPSTVVVSHLFSDVHLGLGEQADWRAVLLDAAADSNPPYIGHVVLVIEGAERVPGELAARWTGTAIDIQAFAVRDNAFWNRVVPGDEFDQKAKEMSGSAKSSLAKIGGNIHGFIKEVRIWGSDKIDLKRYFNDDGKEPEWKVRDSYRMAPLTAEQARSIIQSCERDKVCLERARSQIPVCTTVEVDEAIREHSPADLLRAGFLPYQMWGDAFPGSKEKGGNNCASYCKNKLASHGIQVQLSKSKRFNSNPNCVIL
jgi:hypothetical protein